MTSSEVQRRLFATGFRCPRLLYGPDRITDLAVTVEEFVEGEPMVSGDEAAEPLAVVLADLVDRAPPPEELAPLPPHYAFLQWSHSRPGRVWPSTPEIGVDLNQDSFVLPWVDNLAGRVAERLNTEIPNVIGHGDWWSNNIRWRGGSLAAVDDWDSVVALPEAAIAGVAAAVFNNGESTVEQSERFLDAYVAVRSAVADPVSREYAWAAGLWSRLVDAKKGFALGYNDNLETLLAEAPERAARGGV